jgi:hypothetical protein
MEEVGTRVWHFDRDVDQRGHGAHGGIHDFKGTYEEFAASVA